MLITSIEACKRSRERYNVYGDGEFLTALYGDTITKFGMAVDVNLSETQMEEIVDYDKTLHARRVSFNLLAVRDLSRAKLLEKLKQKGVDEDYANSAARYLRDQGYIDDVRFAENKAKYLFEVKHYGKMRVKNTLIHDYGIDRQVAESALDDVTESEDFSGGDVLYRDLCKHFENKDLSDRNIVGKAVQKFMRKGFSYDDIKSVIRKITDEVEFFD